MKTQIDKNREQQHSGIPRVLEESSTGGTATIIDNRPSTVYQRKLRETMNAHTASKALPIQQRENKTGLPDKLKTGIENLSGYAMDDVRVHYNSGKPAKLQAHAYAQGTEIHLAPGQEKHLPHEAWHVVQQRQKNRVKPTMRFKNGLNINDDVRLEKEADIMGQRAMRIGVGTSLPLLVKEPVATPTYQMAFDVEGDLAKLRQVHAMLNSDGADRHDRRRITSIIYNILSTELNSVYEVRNQSYAEFGTVEGSDYYMIDDDDIEAQNHERAYRDARRDPNVERDELRAFARAARVSSDRIREGDQGGLNLYSFMTKGDYFHYVSPAGTGSQERIVLNINKQETALNLLHHIKEAFTAEEVANDWRSHVRSVKAFAHNYNKSQQRRHIKYDKVVVYYDSEHRDAILRGLTTYVDEEDRTDTLPAFYNKLAKGVGQAQQTTDPVNLSFGRANAIAIVNWIYDDKGLETAKAMPVDQFADEARQVVLANLSEDFRRAGGAIAD